MATSRKLGKGLGKGLDSMIPEKIVEEGFNPDGTPVARETEIELAKIEPNRSQPRKIFNEDALVELADSIKQYGVIQPLILQKRDKYYEIVAGERRWRAAKLAGLKKVPAIIKEYSPQEVMEIALIENIQREDLNPIEEAQAFQRLISEFSLKQDELAQKVGKSRVAITNSMRLLKLDSKVQQMLIDDMISSGHARAILGIEDKDEQVNVATKVFDEKLSVRETEKLVKQLTDGQRSHKRKQINVELSEQEMVILKNVEEKMKKILGTKVLINQKVKDKGKIEIEYYSNEELERLMEIFESIR